MSRLIVRLLVLSVLMGVTVVALISGCSTATNGIAARDRVPAAGAVPPAAGRAGEEVWVFEQGEREGMQPQQQAQQMPTLYLRAKLPASGFIDAEQMQQTAPKDDQIPGTGQL